MKDMEYFDRSFNFIKQSQSIQRIEDILETLKRNYDKNNELYSLTYEISNKIEDYEHKIELSKEQVIMLMEMTSKANIQDKNEKRDQEEIERTRREHIET